MTEPFTPRTPLPARYAVGDEDVSDRSRLIALALCAFPPLGVFGGHRFYTGKVVSGVLQICTLGGLGMWWLYDLVLVLAGGFRDVHDRRVVRWSEGPAGQQPGSVSDRRMDMLLEEMDANRDEMADLTERVDFLERMLTRVRDKDRERLREQP